MRRVRTDLCLASAGLLWFAGKRRPKMFGEVGPCWVCSQPVQAQSAVTTGAVMLVFPLALGELVRSISRRKVDWPVWLAFCGAGLPLLIFSSATAGKR